MIGSGDSNKKTRFPLRYRLSCGPLLVSDCFDTKNVSEE